ncbi:VOC family protein [Rhodococcus sp. NPDC058521]|uniref:VOC family protein n=1 Tax=Rhodococcus sp. NPDC058521 TaxID=3346536 RepID=UPI00364900A5
MKPTGVVANINVTDIDEAKRFYSDYLGLSDVAFDLGWVVNLQSADGRASVQLVGGDATSPADSAISVHVGDQIEEAYEDAQQRGYEVVYPLTTESWGVRRFFVRAPDGTVVNIVSHVDEA